MPFSVIRELLPLYLGGFLIALLKTDDILTDEKAPRVLHFMTRYLMIIFVWNWIYIVYNIPDNTSYITGEKSEEIFNFNLLVVCTVVPALGDPRRERPPAVYGHDINVPTHFNVPIRPSDERPPAM